MSFVTIQRFTESAKTASPERTAEVRDQSWAYISKYLKSGELKEALWFADGNGGMSIWDLASADELYRVLQENPARAHIHTEAIPLVTYQDLENLRKAREAAKKPAKK
jgi:hypothetical protein